MIMIDYSKCPKDEGPSLAKKILEVVIFMGTLFMIFSLGLLIVSMV
jgi:hypothetical protein